MNRAGWRDRARTGALALVVFALAHNLTFLFTYGGAQDQALARTGHGQQWTVTVALVAILALILAVSGIVRLAQLSRLARVVDLGATKVANAAGRDFAGHLARAWVGILGVALILFVCAENLEHLSVGLPAPGLSVLDSIEYHEAFAIFAAVAFVAAAIDALYGWRRELLIARIEAACTRWVRAGRSAPRPTMPWVDRRHGAIAGHRIAGRAPPLLAG